MTNNDEGTGIASVLCRDVAGQLSRTNEEFRKLQIESVKDTAELKTIVKNLATSIENLTKSSGRRDDHNDAKIASLEREVAKLQVTSESAITYRQLVTWIIGASVTLSAGILSGIWILLRTGG